MKDYLDLAWRPIETAPKKGQILIAGGVFWWDSMACPVEGIEMVGVAMASWDGQYFATEDNWFKPTHWLPVPEFP